MLPPFLNLTYSNPPLYSSHLSQVFLIIHYQPLVNSLADVILNGDLSVCTPQTDELSTYKNPVTHKHTHTQKQYNNIDMTEHKLKLMFM